MGVRAKCSRCDYLRTFADELRGTYYRCPKCRDGVIAVPADATWQEESAEAPRVLAARTPDNRSSEEIARAIESSDDSRAIDSASNADASTDHKIGVDETPKGVLSVALAGREQDPGLIAEPGSETAPDAISEEEKAAAIARGQTFKVRRILVECVGCGHHVAVPPQFFGKTVHCPECRADMAFSESSLEPVKDEILGRIALEHAERRVLKHAVPPPIESPEARRRAERKVIAIGAALIFLLFVVVVVVVWKIATASVSAEH